MAHPLFREAVESLRQRLMAEWETSPARDTEGRERLWLMLKLLGNVEGHLKEVMQTGQLSRLQLEQQKSLMSRAKDWMEDL